MKSIRRAITAQEKAGKTPADINNACKRCKVHSCNAKVSYDCDSVLCPSTVKKIGIYSWGPTPTRKCNNPLF